MIFSNIHKKQMKPVKYNWSIIVGLTVLAGVICYILFSWFHVGDRFTTSPELSDEPTIQDVNAVSDSLHLRDSLIREPQPGHMVEWPAMMAMPTANYPVFDNLLHVVQKWNPDNPDQMSLFKETLQHFNYSNLNERKMAENFRNAELPFKLYDVPELKKVVNKWTDNYLLKQFHTNAQSHVESSRNNHFMYWALKGWRVAKNFVPPTTIVNDMSFQEWLKKAKQADIEKMSNESQHFYFMTNALAGDRMGTFVGRDLDMFSTRTNNFFITNVRANKGIQCRFGMRGVISEDHYDTGKNMIAMLRGSKRYILNPPKACKQLGIITDVNHPSYRHSVIDWSDEKQATASGFGSVPAIDTVLRKGEILYVPSYWFHYMVSLDYSIQCNSRSGTPDGKQGQADIEACLGTRLNQDRYNNKRRLRTEQLIK